MKLNKLKIRTAFGLFFLAVSALCVEAQTILYQENFGVPATSTPVQQYTGWQDATVLYTGNGTCDVRTSSASVGYGGASGGGNVMLNDTLKWFQVSQLNTLADTNLSLYCGLRKTASENGSNFTVEVSGDSVTWVTLTMEDTLPSGTGTSGWYRVRFPGVPSQANLHIRFSTRAQVDYRLDDLALVVGEETQLETVAKPTFAPAGGTYYAPQDVTILSATAGARIYYTLDGSSPDETSMRYVSAIQVAEPLTVKAVAYKEGMYASEIAAASYIILDTNSLVTLPLDLSDNSSQQHLDLTQLPGFRAYHLGSSYADGSAKFEASHAGTAALVAHLDSSPQELSFDLRGKKSGSSPSAYEGIAFVVSQSPDGESWMELIRLTETEIELDDYAHFQHIPLRSDTRYIRWRLDAATKGNTQLNNVVITRNLDPGTGDTTVVLDYRRYPIALYPNPTSGILNVHRGGVQLQRMVLLDLAGQEVASWSGNAVSSIDLTHLPAGAYMLQIYTDEGVMNRKVVKY